jgi:hypothetical protein
MPATNTAAHPREIHVLLTTMILAKRRDRSARDVRRAAGPASSVRA